MRTSQSLTIRSSEIRARLNELSTAAEMTDEHRAEVDTLTTEYAGVETRRRAALVAEDAADVETRATEDPQDAEHRERVELRGRARLGGFLVAAMTGRMPGGAEAEYAASCGATAGEVPLDLLETDRPVEHRADAASTVPASGSGATLGAIQPYVFSQSIASRLGITMPTVGSGAYSEMTITTALTAGATA